MRLLVFLALLLSLDVGKELRFVLARFGELAALVLDFIERRTFSIAITA